MSTSLPTYPPDPTLYTSPYTPPKLEPVRTTPTPYSSPVPNTPKIPSQTPPFRHPDFTHNPLITTPHNAPTVTTTFHILKRSRDRWPNRPAMGTRKVLNVREVEKAGGKKWTISELGDYEYLSFRELYEEVLVLGDGLRALVSRGGGDQGDESFQQERIGIFMQTCAKWMQTSLAAASQALTVVTAYDTLGPKALGHSLRETNSSVLVTEGRLLSVLLVDGVLDMVSGLLKTIVYTTDYGRPENLEELMDKIRDKSKIDFLSWEEFRKLGHDNPLKERKIPTPEDYLCIMYTSGSTGVPKGVLLKHKTVVSAISAANYMIGKWVTPHDRFLAYLPLAHIVEFELEHTSIFLGACLGYGRPQTLTPAAGSLERGCKGDIEEFKPTIMHGVPQVWETIKKGITRKIDSSGYLTKTLFDNALAFRIWAYGGQGVEDPKPPTNPVTKLAVSVLDSVVFSQIRSALGGHIRVGLSGAAKLNRNTSEWLTHVLGVPIIRGYALTETAALLALMPPDQFSTMSEGQIVPCAEVKLVSYPEAGYSVLDEPNPRGEIWVRGNCVTEGYFLPRKRTRKEEEELQNVKRQNDEAFTVDEGDGYVWFRTGDIGEIELLKPESNSHERVVKNENRDQKYGGDPNRDWTPFLSFGGHLRIVDRKKNLQKTSRGEYIALEKLEALYRSAPVVSNIAVFVRDDKPKPVAIVHPVESYIRQTIVGKVLIPAGGLTKEEEEKMTLGELVKLRGVRREVLRELQNVGKQAGLSGLEVLEGIGLVGGEEWSSENGLVTSTRKVVRREVEKRFAEDLEGAWEMSR